MKTNGKTEPTRVNMFVVENVVESIQNNGSDLEKNISTIPFIRHHI